MKAELKQLVTYHEEQIVSRSLSKRLGIISSVTLYAMDQKESISKETSPQPKLLQVLEGRLAVTLEEGTVEILETGELLSIAAQQLHSLNAITPCKFLQIELP
ncbi:acetate kinase [Streptococcus sp. DD13]|uniref:acetate kinase n=1 Tax=Streptococcus sp. DD13 TaxID=1777881 RepID=UPI000797940B|nr:acetate kinase [Streptococcus sp. DD13]KXT78168.1 hypothetical protein STRDD13_00993 [Streptococcus sp. DD13]